MIDNYLHLERPHTKREVAFLMSMKMIFESSKRCYFWTLTPAWPMGDNRFVRAVHTFCFNWRNHMRDKHGLEKSGWGPGFMAMRVFEPFKSGFLHCHFVCNRRLPVREIRRIAEKTGIGRIDVKPCNPGVADYLCKYMRKEHVLPGIRTFAKWGDWEHVRINNVEVDSHEARLMKWCRMNCEHETRKTFSMQTGEIYTTYVKKNRHQAWIDARVMFAKEMVRHLKNRHPRMLHLHSDGRYYDEAEKISVDPGQLI